MESHKHQLNVSDHNIISSDLNSDRRSHGETILIVEDEFYLLYLTQEQLKQDGYRTYIASTAAVALDLLEKHDDIKMLLSDVILPNSINGYELASQALTIKPQLKILFISGFSADVVKEKGLALFEAEILQKPFRHADLTKTIRKVFDNKSTEASFS